MPQKEDIKEIPKVWGKEIWLVNCPEYCGKLLVIDKDAMSSWHYHKIKKETFYLLAGIVYLTVEDGDYYKSYYMSPSSRPKTIFPGEKHEFRALTKSIILEISTEHKEEDVVRLNESRAGCPEEKTVNELLISATET